MTTIEYAYVPTNRFEVKVFAVSNEHIFTVTLVKHKKFDTSMAAISYVKSITPEDALSYEMYGSTVMGEPMDNLEVFVRRHVFEYRRSDEVYIGLKTIAESHWRGCDSVGVYDPSTGDML